MITEFCLVWNKERNKEHFVRIELSESSSLNHCITQSTATRAKHTREQIKDTLWGSNSVKTICVTDWFANHCTTAKQRFLFLFICLFVVGTTFVKH